MRVGIYLGRHAGSGGGIGIYCRSLSAQLAALLESHQFAETEVVLYGDSSILSEEVLDVLELSPVLSSLARRGAMLGASWYFRRLPNGARCRILIRSMSRFGGHRLSALLDQIRIPLLMLLDRVQLLHSTANCGLFISPAPQVITVHDLYQAWPEYESRQKKQVNSGKFTPWIRSFYRALFRRQFKTAAHILTDTTHVAREVQRRYTFDQSKSTVVPLGLDAIFLDAHRSHSESNFLSESERWLAGLGLPKGYTLVFASLDPRKNLARTIEAWSNLPQHLQDRGLVIVCGSSDTKRAAQSHLGNHLKNAAIFFLKWLPREELPYAYCNAGAALLPTLAEGFGFPALEAVSLSCPVVTSRLEVLRTLPENVKLCFYCEPTKVQSIRDSLVSALEVPAVRKTTIAKPRTMSQAVEETFSVYKPTLLRYRLGNAFASKQSPFK